MLVDNLIKYHSKHWTNILGIDKAEVKQVSPTQLFGKDYCLPP